MSCFLFFLSISGIDQPEIVIESKTLDRKTGFQSYTLRCLSSGNPSVHYQWKSGNGSTLTNSATLTIDNSNYQGGNIIYKCVVNNGREEKSTEKSLEFYGMNFW